MNRGSDPVTYQGKVNELSRLLRLRRPPRIADRQFVPREVSANLAMRVGISQESILTKTSNSILYKVLTKVGSENGLEALRAGDVFRLLDEIYEVALRYDEAHLQDQRNLIRAAPTSLSAERTLPKAELVKRIADLTGAPRLPLGPGSKEKKAVLEHLYRGLNFGEPPSVSKTILLGKLIERLGGYWSPSFSSAGYTLTAEGLQYLHDLAADHLSQRRNRLLTPEQEAQKVGSIIFETVSNSLEGEPPAWDGRSAVERMLAAQSSNARQTEWAGFYFEFLVLPRLIESLGGSPKKRFRTEFDYVRQHTWDLKTHASRSDKIPLNDQYSIDRTIEEEEGIGFVILSGDVGLEGEDAFYVWHKQMREKTSQKPVTPEEKLLRERTNSRRLKPRFEPRDLKIIWIDKFSHRHGDVPFALFRQGRQQSGAAREPKYNLSLRALGEFTVFEKSF